MGDEFCWEYIKIDSRKMKKKKKHDCETVLSKDIQYTQ